MTGKYPSRLNITDWIRGDNPNNRPLLGPEDNHQLPLSEVTIAESLKEYGYKTFFAGKWHLGDTGYFPENQGFDTNLGGHHMGQPPGGYYSPYNNPKLSDGPEGEYLTDRLGDESVKFINENRDSPFLLYLAFYTVHTPIQPNKKYLPYYEKKREELDYDKQIKTENEGNAQTVLKQQNAQYASMVASMDENVGKVVEALRKNGLDQNTYIFFTSDNGGLTTNTGSWISPTSVRPLRAGKGWAYEGGIRVPLIITGPDIEPNRVSSLPVISTDFYPTILELASLPFKPEQHIDGISLAKYISSRESPGREILFWHYPHYHSSGWTPGSAIRKGDWKLVEFFETGVVELYNLAEDRGESHDLSLSYPEVTVELLNDLHRLQKETGACFPTLNPDILLNQQSEK
jgi:arylsulfatase A-like enzyme